LLVVYHQRRSNGGGKTKPMLEGLRVTLIFIKEYLPLLINSLKE